MTEPAPSATTPVAELADIYWSHLLCHEPYYAVKAGEEPQAIDPVDEATVQSRADEARALRERLRTVTPRADEADLAAVLDFLLTSQIDQPGQMWHVHLTAPYQAYFQFGLVARTIVAMKSGTSKSRLTQELARRAGSIAAVLREQRRRGIVLPRPATAGVRTTWTKMLTDLPTLLDSAELANDLKSVLHEIELSAESAEDAIGMSHLPGGEDTYRAWVRRETTEDVTPEELHQLGLEQCAELAESMAEIRLRLGGPSDEAEARKWVQVQAHLYASSSEEVAGTYRRHIDRVEPRIDELFRKRPRAAYDVRRLVPADEAGMTFGYYELPTPEQPVGFYRFNGSNLAERSTLTSAALILHELIPGHHFHLARQAENTALHPLQQHTIAFGAFNEGWGEYASGLGWELGAYDDDWDAYGRLAHERFVAQRLVVDTALNLGWWDLSQAREFMQANTLESDLQIASETLRYATDMPAQSLAYRSGYLAFCRARGAAAGTDIRDVHEAMIAGGAVPLPRMRQRVDELGNAEA